MVICQPFSDCVFRIGLPSPLRWMQTQVRCNCYLYRVVKANQSHPPIEISTGLQMAFGMTNKLEWTASPWLQGAHRFSGTAADVVQCCVIISQTLPRY